MSRYTGRTIFEIDAPSDQIEKIASDFLAAARLAATDFDEILELSVAPDAANRSMSVTLVMEADGTDELDDVADRLIERAMNTLSGTADAEADELTVVESALVPA